jgi:hypothetical protein
MWSLILKPICNCTPGEEYLTRDNSWVKVTECTWCYIKGHILKDSKWSRKEYFWLDTGNYIGSNYPHKWDIQKRKTFEIFSEEGKNLVGT